ncbi:MAG TPA: aldose epimerase family protein [Frateuria sp.]|uniref:aldose epimerase family protein n=1 Tax=Frateuria sp. TaxID=2211372 RepID=UPI002D7FF084|nr:aldose epimerase family protein [Frateuria sp.]HET6805936.1 aldose epimerase family protein [Frateuria sp.]
MRRAGWIGSMLGLAALSMTAHAGTMARRETFGTMPDGKPVEAVVLTNAHGLTARVIAYGASLQSLSVPDREGHLADIVLGYPTLKGYLDQPQYFGATVGRYANRIARGRFVLDGKTYQVPVNNGPNSLHGGTRGFDKVLWTVAGTHHDASKASVTLSYVSPDGDMGYPGTLSVTATYTLDDRDQLSIAYRATTDRPTIVNLSNHAYWNLSGEGSGSVMDERLTIPADAFLPVDAGSIPTGEIRPVAGTPFDFRRAKPIGRDIRTADPQLLDGHGYDHNWVVSRKAAAAPRMVARVEDPASGRVLTLSSAQPGLQFYSGNFLDGTTVGTGGHVYRQGDAFVLEPQLYPDTPNQPDFGSARLAPGQVYRNLIVYRFTTEPARSAR